MVERVEVSFRTALVNNLCVDHGTNWYEEQNLFTDPLQYSKNLIKLVSEIDRSGEYFIKHYKTFYQSPQRPPAWMSLEIASLGLLSTTYRNLKMSPAKKRIALQFGIKAPYVFESWMESLTYVRNVCAHHARLWNRNLTIKPQLPKTTTSTFLVNTSAPNTSLYTCLSCLLYLRKNSNPKTELAKRIRQLFIEYPNVDIQKMGFLSGWEKEPIWAT